MARIKTGKSNLNHKAKTKTASRKKHVTDPQLLTDNGNVSYLIKFYIFLIIINCAIGKKS